jgi:hypothetical protein
MSLKLYSFITTLILVCAPTLVLAQANTGNPFPPANTGDPLPTANSTFILQNPLSFGTLCGLLKAVFNALLTIGIPIAVFFIVYAGFLFVTARGNPEGLKKAKLNALYVVVGIAVFLGAWLLTQIVSATIQSLGGPAMSSCS